MSQETTTSPARIIGGVLALGVVIALIVWIATNESMRTPVEDSTNTEEMEQVEGANGDEMMDEDDSAQDDAEDMGMYVDGEYTATGAYTSPAGQEEVEVVLTVENDVIVAAEFDGKASNPTSVLLQGMFAEGFESEVVGKSLDELSLGVVNGSSLTPKGFMDAVEQIREEAAA